LLSPPDDRTGAKPPNTKTTDQKYMQRAGQMNRRQLLVSGVSLLSFAVWLAVPVC